MSRCPTTGPGRSPARPPRSIPGTPWCAPADSPRRLIETSILARVTTDPGCPDTERLYYHVKPYGREDELILEVTINGDRRRRRRPVRRFRSGPLPRSATCSPTTPTRPPCGVPRSSIPGVPASAMRCTGGPTLGHYQSMVCTATIRITAGTVVQPGDRATPGATTARGSTPATGSTTTACRDRGRAARGTMPRASRRPRRDPHDQHRPRRRHRHHRRAADRAARRSCRETSASTRSPSTSGPR